ncbi:MAG TPA: HipA N-terminal domain-containing protein, partial [Bacteroidia bacterium]|nr:HipA N-terminal domain-containing protein [Bacteroidia bacterium]
MNPIPEIAVSAWGRPVGILTDGDAGTTFRYSPEMLDAGISFSPLNYPAIGTVYSGSRVRGMYGLPSF